MPQKPIKATEDETKVDKPQDVPIKDDPKTPTLKEDLKVAQD